MMTSRQRLLAACDTANRRGSRRGMGAVVWLMGIELAIFLAMDHPDVFSRLFEFITEPDRGCTELAASDPGVDDDDGRGGSGTRLMEDRVDVLYFVNPIQDDLPVERRVHRAMEVLAKTGCFVL